MANKNKTGLTYFPFEVTFFNDIKLRKLIKYQGCKATPIYTLLLCNIYEKGYYLTWDNELPFIISETTGYEEGYVKEVITCCLNVGLFNKEMFDKNKILTSKGIQDRYELICKQLKRNAKVSEYKIIVSEEKGKTSEESDGVPEEIPQRKGNESEGKEIKGNESEDAHELFGKIFFELKNSQRWIEDLCRIYKKSLEYLQEKLTEFLNELLAKDDYYKGISEIKKHFVSWLKIQIEKEKKSAKKENGKSTSENRNDRVKSVTDLKNNAEAILAHYESKNGGTGS